MRYVLLLVILAHHTIHAQQCSTFCTGCAGCVLTVTQNLSCPAYSLTLVASATSITQCACVAGTYGTNGSPCTQCPTGTYSPTVGATTAATCTQCSTGQYSTALGATASATCTACPVGQYCATVGTAPAPCTNKPANATYTTTATTATGCQFVCDPGYYQLNSTYCAPCPAGSWCYAGVRNTCPTNAQSPALASSQNQCLCKQGYFGNGTASGTSPCPICRAGSYCPGGNSNLTFACPAYSTSPIGSYTYTQCQCLPGYLGANGTTCTLCPANSICASGSLSACPANTAAPTGSSDPTQCAANAGYYQTATGGAATPCPANSYCTGGLSITACTANAVSPVLSPNSSACYCDRGYQGVQNQPCTPCTQGTWCWTGVLNTCPFNTNSPALSSYMANCTCNPGYTGPNGGPCTPCAPGNYKAAQGAAACAACPDNSFAPAYNTTLCTSTTICVPGAYPTTPYTATTDNVCGPCPPNYQCQNNLATACPSITISPQGAKSYLDCYCPPGTYGVVQNPATAQCTPCAVGQYCPANNNTCTC